MPIRPRARLKHETEPYKAPRNMRPLSPHGAHCAGLITASDLCSVRDNTPWRSVPHGRPPRADAAALTRVASKHVALSNAPNVSGNVTSSAASSTHCCARVTVCYDSICLVLRISFIKALFCDWIVCRL
ncbi:unnamed protein product, partial [Iphiclides podalirius]